MGIGGISIWQLAIILVIVLLLFGTKKLRGLGGDLGGAIKGFKKAMNDDKPDADSSVEKQVADQTDSDESATNNVNAKAAEKAESK